jgi:hypothetical protein
VRSEGRCAWFQSESGDGAAKPILISLTESLTDADEVTSRLEAARSLQHPNLLEIRHIGRSQMDQTPFVYAVMEPVDQTLSDVLQAGTLSTKEARQITEAIVDGLAAIHRQGFAHGRVEPSSVLAVGEAVKLRSDCLQAPGATRAGDVAGLGATIFELFTQQKAASASDAQINRIPAPFGEIVRNYLSARWSLSQIQSVLRPSPTADTPPAVSPAPMPIPAGPVPITSKSPIASEAKSPPPPAAGKLQAPSESGGVPEDRGEQMPAPRRRFAPYAIAGAIFVLFLLWLLLHIHSQKPAVTTSVVPAAPAPQQPSLPLPAAPTKPTASIKPSPTSPSGPHSALSAHSVWRVVTYTYHHEDQAQHKANEINSKHPGLQAAVFQPAGDTNHFLVVLGGAMEQRQAFRVRAEAQKAGLASDTYVQDFSE